MWKLLIAASTLLSTGYGNQVAESQFGRFLASLSTVTSTTYLTTSDTCTFSTSCAAIDVKATACRRRRHGLPIEDIEPSATIPVEHSAAAEMSSSLLGDRLFTLDSSVDDAVQLDISGFPDQCAGNWPRNFINLVTNFGITIFVTSTSTVSTTCGTSRTVTNTYSIVGCSPYGLVTCTSSLPPPLPRPPRLALLVP